MTVSVGILKLYVNCCKRTHADEEIKRSRNSLSLIDVTLKGKHDLLVFAWKMMLIKKTNLGKEKQDKIQRMST